MYIYRYVDRFYMEKGVSENMETKRDIYGRAWITENAKRILSEYGGGITIRQLHYRLVAAGMINDVQHYKRVVDAMTEARWSGIVDMDAFIDRERSMYGQTEAEDKDLETEIDSGKRNIKAWMEFYNLNRWSNQPEYVEVWIEKKALQGVFERPCSRNDVGLAPCKGYPSLSFLNDAYNRFSAAESDGKRVVILYFGDYDPSGEDIPRSLKENLSRMGVDVEVERMALNQKQITEMGLPSVPPKKTDSRTSNWDGEGVVELDAVEPNTLAKMAEDAINAHFDRDSYAELKETESKERAVYIQSLKEFVEKIGENDDNDPDVNGVGIDEDDDKGGD